MIAFNNKMQLICYSVSCATNMYLPYCHLTKTIASKKEMCYNECLHSNKFNIQTITEMF